MTENIVEDLERVFPLEPIVPSARPFVLEVPGEEPIVSDEVPDILEGGEPVVPPQAAPGDRLGGRQPHWKWGATRSRRAAEIRAYVGLNGHGKSLAMVKDMKPSLDRNRQVLSTVRLLDPFTGNPHPLWVPIDSWLQLLDHPGHADVLFDEILGIASSRASNSMPSEVQNFLHQLRRRDMTLSWSSPSWTRADVTIREVTKRVTICRGYLPKVERVKGEDDSRAWANNRLFRFTTYDAADFTEWSDNKETTLKGVGNEWMLRRGHSWASLAYDTFDAVDRIGEVLDSGRCAVCGGTRTPAKCSCDGTHRHAYRTGAGS